MQMRDEGGYVIRGKGGGGVFGRGGKSSARVPESGGGVTKLQTEKDDEECPLKRLKGGGKKRKTVPLSKRDLANLRRSPGIEIR